MTQLWQLCKKQIWIPVTTIVAIMAILKNPGDINCCNYGNFEGKKYMDPFSSQLSQLWQFWKRNSWLLMTTIAAIVAIVEKTNTNPGDNNCRNCGNSEKSWWQQLSQLCQFWKKKYGSLSSTIVAMMAFLKKIQLTPDDSNCCNCGNLRKFQTCKKVLVNASPRKPNLSTAKKS